MADLFRHQLGVRELLAGYQARRFQPSEILAECTRSVMELDGQVGAVVVLDPRAQAAAVEADQRWQRSEARPLEGIPFGAKDVIQVSGIVTTFGSLDFRHAMSQVTADSVRRLQDAGAICFGKLATYEFAAGPNDRTKNPWHTGRKAGGSSSGSAAAVAAGFVPFAIGTDTGGSIRVPAAWCGVVGVKPTLGRVCTHGVAALSWTLDHVGPLTQSVEDAELVLAVMASDAAPYRISELRHEVSTSLRGVRIGRPSNWFFDYCEPEISYLVERAISELVRLGASVIDVDLPLLRKFNPDIIKHVLVGAEAASFHRERRDRWHAYSDGLRDVLLFGDSLSAVEYIEALRLRSVLTQVVSDVFDHVEALVMPTCGIQAPPAAAEYVTIGDDRRLLGDVVARNTSIFNICGFPAATLPCGLMSSGLPAGMQIAAAPWREDVCFRIGRAYEENVDKQLRGPH